jgi:rhomboid family GlyGly-CTERM serine protease
VRIVRDGAVHAENAPPLSSQGQGQGRPWLAATFSIVALAAWFLPGAHEFFLYDRGRIAGGQWWRVWSGHLAHHGGSHLIWNLVVFLPAAAWIESIAPRAARIFLTVAPLFISAALWFFESRLQVYAGLSGVTVGAVALLAFVQLRKRSGEPRWIWIGALVLVLVKIVAEFVRPETAVFADLPNGIRNVPLAHLAGAMCAGLIALPTWRKTKDS